MASSSDTCSSALSYALERFAMPNLTLKEEQLKSLEAVYQGNSVFVWIPTLLARDRVQERATW